MTTRHYLMGPHDRKYTFAHADADDNVVRVRRYERGLCVSEKLMAKGAARRLWRWLVSQIGYARW